MQISDKFEAYTEFGPSVPVWCITPTGLTGCIHRFFDSSPISPSGRYVALTRLPDETRPPCSGEEAEVVLVDLLTGEADVVARTRGFDTQLGAQAQWGRTDEELYGTTPIRWVDLEAETEATLVRIRSQPLEEGPLRVLRVDPHPAWDREFRRVVFNACLDGKRRVYLADLSNLVSDGPGS